MKYITNFRKKYGLGPPDGNDGGADGTIKVMGKSFNTPKKTFIEWTRTYMGGVIHEVLADPKVNQEGLNFLDRAFRHPQTHEAGQFLLINVLNDKRFVDASKVFGVDLIAHVIQQDKAQEEFKRLIVKTLQDEKVLYETVNILKFLTD